MLTKTWAPRVYAIDRLGFGPARDLTRRKDVKKPWSASLWNDGRFGANAGEDALWREAIWCASEEVGKETLAVDGQKFHTSYRQKSLRQDVTL
ncbi:protein of unknown function [Candidatus Filomicrobium marinum]|uniref:Transposase n=1 Tax=Filomicrobium insigne TaxID=418854 RepID=A0A1H0LDE9_9HYPH|nr:protein of unknown function [Candidatus Filomicrobium marinum]SDO66227.1 hypothetical protein SAMN04488061_1334 [Filomicrobium insigne]